MTEVIGISGKPRAGKDTIADVLVEHFGYKKISFATPLKEITSDVFKLDMSHFGDDKDIPFNIPITVTKTHLCHILDNLKEYNNAIDISEQTLFNKFEGTELKTPRNMLQFVGTEVVRKTINQMFWIELFNVYVNKYDKVVCPDARMPNERQYLKDKFNTEIILINRPNFDIGDNYESENSLGSEDEYDVIVTNDGSLIALQQDIKCWYTYIREHRVRSRSHKKS